MIRVCVLLVFLLCSNHAVSGSGAGGIIKVINKASFDIAVYWVATTILDWPACFYQNKSLSTLTHCDSWVLSSGEEYTYSYNWGVKETWIRLEWWEKDAHAVGPVLTEVSVPGWEMKTCTITGEFWPVSVACE